MMCSNVRSMDSRIASWLRGLLGILLMMAVSVPVSQGQEKMQGTEQEAKKLLLEFVQPGADVKALSKKLQPAPDDYDLLFDAPFAAKLKQLYEPAWQSNQIIVSGKPGQTQVLLFSATSAELQSWTGKAKEHFPGGYERVGVHFKNGHTVYRFKFVTPGESLGMAYDGLVFIRGQWRLFPKPYRAVSE